MSVDHVHHRSVHLRSAAMHEAAAMFADRFRHAIRNGRVWIYDLDEQATLAKLDELLAELRAREADAREAAEALDRREPSEPATHHGVLHPRRRLSDTRTLPAPPIPSFPRDTRDPRGGP